MASNRYCIDLAKRGTAGCKNCKQKIEKGVARIGKIIPNPFTDIGGEMKQWFHVKCMFEALSRARATTKKIEEPDDLEGWDDISDDCKAEVMKYIIEFSPSVKKTPAKKPKRSKSKSPVRSTKKTSPRRSASPGKRASPSTSGGASGSGKDDTFREFRRLCAKIAEESSYNGKTAIVSEFFDKGPDGKGFNGDFYLWIKLLLPGVNKRVYNLQSKQLVKLFSQIFDASQDEMLEDLEQGDVAETVSIFFENSERCQPKKKSTLTLEEVDDFLNDLTKVTKEEEQTSILKDIAKRCTSNDLKMFIRLIKHDLRINTGPKHILEALHSSAYQAFQASRNLKDVVKRSLKLRESGSDQKGLDISSSLMTPVLPMLAQPCRKIETAFKKCPNGLLVEIKYDGERVQVHKKGNDFCYFSRSLKPVLPHKVSHLKDYIPKAFPYGSDLILDSEILLVDNEGKPLPFGTLGAHKKTAFQDATVCLFVFDCLLFNKENLILKPLEYRRKILQENMKEIKNHVMFSEMKPVKEPKMLKKMIKSVIEQGLEGLIIKDKKSVYEPGKRHWLKVKKDYLEEGAMADSADLVVLGAYYGTGNKGGMKSVFLMGCLNEKTGKWCTVTKVGGHTDATLAKLQRELDMVKISKDASRVPKWLNVNKSLVPDFVVKDPDESQVWEITGAEFTKAEVHTADGISIRFPRVSHIRKDKGPDDATTLQELQKLYKLSKQKTDMVGLSSKKKGKNDFDGSGETSSSESDAESDGSDRKGRKRSSSGTPASTPKKRKSSPQTKKSESGGEISFENSSDSFAAAAAADLSTQASSSKSAEVKSYQPSADSSAALSRKTIDLPNIFTGIKLFIPASIDGFDILHRYFIAYDGIFVKEHEKEKADFVISPTSVANGRQHVGDANLVAADWLWDCIKLQEMLPIGNYKISLSS